MKMVMFMKLPIDFLSKEDRKKISNNFRKTPAGKEQLTRLLRLFITGLLAVGVSIYLIYSAYVDIKKCYEYLIPIVLLIFGLIFIGSSIVLKHKSLNKYYVNNKKTSRL